EVSRQSVRRLPGAQSSRSPAACGSTRTGRFARKFQPLFWPWVGASAETHRFEIVIGLNDLAQPVFAGTIAAIGVRMMALDQGLEADLDLNGGRPPLEAGRVGRPSSGIGDAPAAAPAQILAATRAGGTKVAEQTERIVGAFEVGLEPRRMRARAWAAAVHAHLPGRAVAEHRLFLIAGDVGLAHAGEEIIRMIVLADMSEAEAPVLVLTRTALRRPMGSRPVAARPFATRVLGAQPTILVGLDPNTVEQGRVVGHDRTLCRRSASTFKS